MGQKVLSIPVLMQLIHFRAGLWQFILIKTTISRNCPRYSRTIAGPSFSGWKILSIVQFKKRWMPLCPPRSPSNYEEMIRHFIDCLINNKEPLICGEDGARVVEVMCAVFESMKANTWVELLLKEEIIPPHYRVLPREE